MPNGHRRNRNSRHANTQRNIQNASVVQAYEPPTTVAEIAEILVAAEEYVDNSDEIERLKSSLDSMRKGYARQQKEICKLKKEEKEALSSADSFMCALIKLRDEQGMISMERNGDKVEIIPKVLNTNDGSGHKEVSFKDIPKLVYEKDTLIKEQEEEIEKLKTFCKSLITKDADGIRKMLKSLQEGDDDLVCDINYSDEETDEETGSIFFKD